MDEIITQIGRLRKLRPEQAPLGVLIEGLLLEIAELQAEEQGTAEHVDEAGDVMGLAIHIAFVAGGFDVESCRRAILKKLDARLSLMEQGLTWGEAKARLCASRKDLN